eukprot:scaffold17877_cov73-Cyclotella_meneghiniana.AAC.4
MKNSITAFTLAVAAASLHDIAAFSPSTLKALSQRSSCQTTLSMTGEGEPQKKGFFQNFFEELDAFVDDATSRRLGNGAQYYGKRKSSFYGEGDANRKTNKNVADPTEDYRGPSNAGYFKWMPDPETGEIKPVTRLKEVNIEKKSRL